MANPPSSNLNSPPLNTFSFSFIDASIAMKKNGVPLIYKNKHLSPPCCGNTLNCYECEYSGDNSSPYGVPIYQGHFNDNTSGIDNNSYLTSSCGNNENHLYWIAWSGSYYGGGYHQVVPMGEWCGNIDTTNSCTLGSKGTGVCGVRSNTCNKDVDWGFNNNDSNFTTQTSNGQFQLIARNPNLTSINPQQDLTTYPTQWIYCTYNYDYTGYSYQNDSPVVNGPLSLSGWFNDIYYNINTNISSSFLTRFLNSTYIYTCIVDFYNQIYNQDFYSTPYQTVQNNTKFLDTSQGGQQAVTNCINSVCNSISGFFQPHYSTGQIPSSLNTALQTILTFPQAKQDQTNSNYSLTFNLPWKMYQTWKTSESQTQQDGYLTNLINSMLGDSKLIISDYTTGTKINASTVILSNSTAISFQCIQVQEDSKGINNYPVFTDTNITNILNQNITNISSNLVVVNTLSTGYTVANTSLYPLCLLTTVQVKATVTKWSPLLILYFYNFNQTLDFSLDDCKNIQSQTRVMPSGCLTISDIVNDMDTMLKLCNVSVESNGYVARNSVYNNMSCVNSSYCYCLTSAISPPNVVPRVGNEKAMCFSNNCESDYLKSIGISDKECSKNCNEVFTWMFNNNTNAPQPVNPSEFNSQKFSELCPGFVANISDKYNTPTLYSTIALVLVFGFFSWSYCKLKKGYSNLITFLLVILTICLIGGLGVFLTIDLAGSGQCESGKWVCRSKKSNIPIPNQFCSYVQDCECTNDGDCGSGCLCLSSLCYPIVGTRSSSTVSESNICIPYIVSILISLLLVPLSIYYMNVKNKEKYIGVFVCVIFVLLLFVLNMTKSVQQINAKVCNT